MGRKRIKRHAKVLLYDASGWVPRGTSPGLQRFLTAAWALGTRAFRGHSIGASSWPEALELLGEHVAEHGSIRELHVWGHGARGRPMIGPVFDLDLAKLHEAVGDNLDAVWWRSCSVHRDPGFAAEVVKELDCASIGHCEVITWPNPLRQRAVCGMTPRDDRPHWRRAGDGTWVNGRGEPLPSVGTLRNRVPYGIEGAWDAA